MVLSGSQKAFYGEFAEHGNGDALVRISPREVVLLTIITRLDLHNGRREPWMDSGILSVAQKGLYNIDSDDIEKLPSLNEDYAYKILGFAEVEDNEKPEHLYLKTLSSLYRRRTKYWRILRDQPFPTADQIAPRTLLEYGNCDDSLLFSWMAWRKLAYDLDNRSGQETGYLFEPILVACLGGASLGARNSVVHRIDDQGNVHTQEGRQVDCYVKETKTVYELKMRVTIAASGQGRFREELSFPSEVAAAGLTPVLVVFDPTSSSRLSELSAAYENAGGQSATGDDAWALLKNNAEDGMAIFIEKYVEPLIDSARRGIPLEPAPITLAISEGGILISSTSGAELRIPRQQY
ncbi:restriction endonuclease [Bifidobacterium asteroides]|uniref:Restriction endonuclease ApaLI n=1 Tax=Bifidobacterium asteroides TaxID=1684 RepID=A0A2N3RAD8_9BIFI|nr:restriction endonuclease [Bifidobacterium asteroides]PKV09440.1 restriction endonuclease ApaLI [Bifidobacterium asteroides]